MDQLILKLSQLNLNHTHLDLQDDICSQGSSHQTEEPLPMYPIGVIDHTNPSSPLSSNPPSTPPALSTPSISTDTTEVSPSPSPQISLNTLLNSLLTEPEYLTHPNLCRIRQISRSTDAAAAFVGKFLYNNRRFHHELETAFLGPYRDAQRGRKAPLNKLVSITGWPGVEPDVITGAILDDCPGCFDWIRRRLPGMDCYGCNVYGWTYVAIAVYARSVEILEYMFAWDQPVGTMNLILCMPANAFQMTHFPTPLSLVAWREDLQFLESLLELWKPCPESRIRKGLSSVDKYFLCTFVTEKIAVRLAEIGFPIQETVLSDLDGYRSSFTSLATSWHAAVQNGPDFLEYLERHSKLSKDSLDANGESPHHYARRANQVDSVLWLQQHNGVPGMSSR
ncbi:uncharacterized protein N7503_002548 [Penicillium pulvis]|uniref:uncharacterized protein n=1 Tax=Penicillium pulvis TaxID=1562058 RepID=UPI0025488898|nr:uncharacterized protein N7503_002548 [Penicillium pulvis]KAJ5810330.1 hypothetical protein N7503_002548 [Penicillium pulvis]